MADIRAVTVADLREAAADLFQRNWGEVERGHWRLDIDWPMYERLEQLGNLIVLGAFSGGRCVGYCTMILSRHMHAIDTVMAQNMVIFVDPAERSRGHGIALMKAAEQEARERGAKQVLWHAKTGSRMERVLTGLGYSDYERTYLKEL